MYHLSIICMFLLLLSQFINFILLNLLDTSILYPIKIVAANGWDELFVLIRAANLNTMTLILFPSIVILLPMIGLFVYYLSNKLSNKKPLYISNFTIAKYSFSIIAILFISDCLFIPHLKATSFFSYQKRFPFAFTFLEPKKEITSLPYFIRPNRNEEELHSKINETKLSIEKKPNIFVFIIESLRRDYITKEIAPTLYDFNKNNIPIDLSFSAANSTHQSWYSIIHSNFAFYWRECKDKWAYGSVPLHILKKFGYDVSVFTSSEINYFQMDKVLFGKDHCLLTKYFEAYNKNCTEAWKRDIKAFEKLKESVKADSNVYITFLDSTHSEYCWPKNYPIKFKPICSNIDYIGVSQSKKTLELTKNRYRNSINFVDDLFNDFFKYLESKNLLDDAIIIITGDHGEEFFEEGAMFHATHLNKYQTNVPIFYKFPKDNTLYSSSKLTSHIDIFPSIIHYLTNDENLFDDLYDGQSIFSNCRWPYCVCIQQNCGDTPNEFMLFDDKISVKARFLTNEIFQSDKIEIIDIKEKENTIEDKKKPFLLELFYNAFKHLSK